MFENLALEYIIYTSIIEIFIKEKIRGEYTK